MLTKFSVVNSSQCMQISYHHVVYLKLIQCGISIIYLKKNWKKTTMMKTMLELSISVSSLKTYSSNVLLIKSQ